MKITANTIKTALLCYYRFHKGELCATEYSHPYGIADVVTLTKNNVTLTEIEVKISKSDLLNELKHKEVKHIMLNEDKHITKSLNNKIPNKFYFCVPEELVEEANKLCEIINPKYGIIVFKPKKRPEASLEIVRNAYKLHSTKLDYDEIRRTITNRICNDICVFYRDEYWS